MAKRKPRRPRVRNQPQQFARLGGVQVAVYGDDTGTPERRQHDPVEKTDTLVEGKLARVTRTVDLMGVMRRNGTITAAQARAGRKFRDDFDLAHLDPSRAADLNRIPCHRAAETAEIIQEARDRVWRALQAVGGHTSIAGQALCHIIGAGHSITIWGDRESFENGKPIREGTARGILIAALGILAPHYGYE